MMFGDSPNITGEIKGMGLINSDKTPSGAFYKGELVNWNIEGKSANSYAIAFDASLSSATYGASATVQPNSLLLMPCIKV